MSEVFAAKRAGDQRRRWHQSVSMGLACPQRGLTRSRPAELTFIGLAALSVLCGALASAQVAPVPTVPAVAPVATAPSAHSAPSAMAAPPPVAAIPQPTVVLMLPLASKALGPAAEALRAGFVAAVAADGKDALPHSVVSLPNDTSALGVAYRNAVKSGARAVVAGLTRDGASITARESGLLPTLALNLPSTDLRDGGPNNYAQISLGLDAEARALAQHIHGEGHGKLILVHTTSPVSLRVEEAFEKEWRRLGGEIALRIPFSAESNDAEKIQRTLDRFAREARGEKGPSLDRPLKPIKLEKSERGERSEKIERPEFAGADAIVLFAETAAARYARPYFPPGVLVFAASTALDSRAGVVQNIDLDAVRFLEMPWFAQPDHPAVMIYAKPETDLPIDYERLYALGIDAWRAINSMLKQAPAKPGRKPAPLEPIDGVTGRLTLDGYNFSRALTLVEMRDGRPQVVGKAE